MTIAIDSLLKSKCHYVVELAVGLIRVFFPQEIDQQMPRKRGNMFYSKKQRVSLLISDLLFLWFADLRFVVPVVSVGD